MDHNEIDKVRNIFKNVQYSKTSHKKYCGILQEIYDKCNLNEFFAEFIKCLSVALRYNEKDPQVHNIIEFAANFVVIQQPANDQNNDSEIMCPFMNKLFNWLLHHHNVKDVSMRYGICSFINTLLNAMGINAYIDDNLCEKITKNMMERLQDKSPKVRAQAILALGRLQEPTDKECPVIKLFINHLLKDPSADVRKAVLNCMAKTQLTLLTVLKKIRDINEDVRKLSFLFISKITVKSLTIKQREFVLNCGLKDPSEKVQQFVKTTLLPAWLLNYNKDYIKLLKGLDVENAAEMTSSCLDILIKNENINSIIEQIPINKITRVIPIEEISSENIMLWHHFIKHLKESNLQEYLEEMLPELSEFCNYIRQFISLMNNTSFDSWEAISQRFILLQLFKITELYDLSDEAGRIQLKLLISETLLSNILCINDLSTDIIKCTVKCLEKVEPSVEERLTTLTHVISELRMPSEQRSQPSQITENELNEMRIKKSKLRVELSELNEEQYQAIKDQNFKKAEELKNEIENIKCKLLEIKTLEKTSVEVPDNSEENVEEKNDVETLWRCLTIMSAMMQSNSIQILTPTIRILMENIAFTNIMHENCLICSLALEVVGICCLLDSVLAKKHFLTFVLYLFVEDQNEVIFKVSLMAIIDILLCYGLQHFDIENIIEQKKNKTMKLFNMDNDEIEDTVSQAQNSNESIIISIIKLLDHKNVEYQFIAAEGLCKLLLSGRISSSNLLSHLIIMLFNPVIESNSALRRTLTQFFNCYINIVTDSHIMLEEAFIPTLRALENAPVSSPLEEIDSLKVSEMIIGLTSCNVSKNNDNDNSVHNNLTFKILNEIIESHFNINLDVLVKSLKFLNVKFDEAQKVLILKELEKAESIVEQEGKYLLKYLKQFHNTINGDKKADDKEDVKEDENEEIIN